MKNAIWTTGCVDASGPVSAGPSELLVDILSRPGSRRQRANVLGNRMPRLGSFRHADTHLNTHHSRGERGIQQQGTILDVGGDGDGFGHWNLRVVRRIQRDFGNDLQWVEGLARG